MINPIVNVVIPTRNRPQLVKRSVLSALSQSLKNIVVTVVIDGADSLTQLALSEIQDPRLKIIELETSQGGGNARMIGANAAQSEWVAFLDDDDEWAQEKLDRQLQTALSSQYEFPVVSCYINGHTPKGSYRWPRRFPRKNEHISEYLLSRTSLFHSEGLIQTSAIFTKMELLRKFPFKSNLKRHQEWDWLITVAQHNGVGFEFVPQTLVTWYSEEQRSGISANNNWQYSLAWIQENRHLVTPRAYSGFIMTVVSSIAAREGDRSAFNVLLKESIQFGNPLGIHYLLYFGMWLIPQDIRRQIRAVLARLKMA